MKHTDKDFEEFYIHALLFEVQRCEAIRNETRKKLARLKKKTIINYAGLFIVLVIIIGLLYLFFDLELDLETILEYLVAIPIVLAFVLLNVYYDSFGDQKKSKYERLEEKSRETIKKIYKQSIFLQIFRYYYPDIKYNPDKKISLNSVRDSKLFFPFPTYFQGRRIKINWY